MPFWVIGTSSTIGGGHQNSPFHTWHCPPIVPLPQRGRSAPCGAHKSIQSLAAKVLVREYRKLLLACEASLAFSLLGKRNLPSVDCFRGTTSRRKTRRLFAQISLVVVDEVPLAKTASALLDSLPVFPQKINIPPVKRGVFHFRA